MLKKKLFKSLKSFTAAAIAALTVTAGITATGATGAGFNPAGLLAPTTAYAFEHQSYADSTGYSLRLDGDTWHCVNADGQIDYSYDGLAENEYGWWKVTGGEVDFGFTGLALNQYGWWYVENGTINFNYTGMAENEYGWWYVTDGAVDLTYTGMALNKYGWWYLTDGTVDFTYNGMAENEFGWWKIKGGAVDFSFTGIASNKYGSWWLMHGTVDFSFTGTVNDGWGNTYDVTGGYAVIRDNNNGSNNTDNGNTGNEENTGKLELVDNQWVYMVDGQIDTSYNYMAKNEYGWWKVTNGVVDTDFAGIAEKEDGTKWLFSGGEWGACNPDDSRAYTCQLNTKYIGTVVVDGVAWDTNRGYVTPAKVDISKTYYLNPDDDVLGKGIIQNSWRGENGTIYILNKDGIVYMMYGDADSRSNFPGDGEYDKETNSWIHTISWASKF